MHSTRLKTIVVPLDGSKLAEEALAAAIVIAEHAGATIHVVRVIDAIWRAPFVAYSPEMIPADTELMAEIESRAREEVETYLEALTESMLTHDVPIHHTMKVGQPAPEIVRAADAVSADLIVISTHGHGGVRRWALGSVTDEILHRGVTPVLVIPPKLSPASMHELQAVVAAVQ
jgi:nucleotide-binding universal stress UspA family protein